jgi:hypothetical protein
MLQKRPYGIDREVFSYHCLYAFLCSSIFKGRPEHYYWIKQVRRARLVQESIRAHNYQHLLKVPEKWIYLLPDEPSPPPHMCVKCSF